MERSRTTGRASRRSSSSPRRSSPDRPAHALLALQQRAGNRAVVAALQKSAGTARSVLALPRQEASLTPLDVVQRVPGAGPGPGPGLEAAGDVEVEGAGVEAPAQDGAAPLEDLVAQQVGALPEVDEAVLPEPQQAEAAREEAAGAPAELAELGVGGDGPLAEWYGRQLGGDGAEAAPPAVEELSAAAGDIEEPAVAPEPSRGARVRAALSGAARWVGEAASSVKGWFGRTFSRENRRDAGAKSQAAAGLGAPVAAHAGDVLSAGQHLVDNTVTTGTAELVAGAGAAEKVHQTGESVGSLSSAAQSSTATLEHPAEFARSFASGGFELAHVVASVVGVFFAGIKAAVDLRSVVSTFRVLKGLKEAERAAAEDGADPEVIAAVKYAIHQKYEKLFKRAVGTAVALGALGVGLALLIANPAGAALAAVILGGVGAGFFAYKLGRWAWKKWKTKTLGVKRKELARALYNHLRLGDELATAAVRSLHLDPEFIARTPNGAALIERKLRSA